MKLLREDAHHVIKTPPAYFRPVVITGDQLPVTPVHMLLAAGLAGGRPHGRTGTSALEDLAFYFNIQIQFVLLHNPLFFRKTKQITNMKQNLLTFLPYVIIISTPHCKNLLFFLFLTYLCRSLIFVLILFLLYQRLIIDYT